uniref:C2 NT-type domain-containing protein n=1 Tax=Leersia perrieri TaxID=77586 RepID=A0A0D9XY10_9ORYZ
MVLGLRTKTRKDASFHVDFNIFIQEISPWPPSESLKSLKSVVLFWENSERNSGKTNAVAPSIGSGTTVGKIEFNEFISLQAIFQKEGSSKSGKWQKNLLELNLYEPRRDKLKGQHLGTATLDLAEHAMFHEDSSVAVPLNSKRSLRNNAQPMVYLRVQPLDGDNSSVSSKDALSKEASVDRDSKELMSATMCEEYTEDTEFASFTDDEEESTYPYCLDGNVRTGSDKSQESLKGKDVRMVGSVGSRSPFDSQREMPSSSTKVMSEEVEKYPVQVQKANGYPGNLSLLSDFPGEQTPSFPAQNALRAGRKMSFAYGMSESNQRNFGERTYSTLTSDRAKNMRYNSMRVPDFSGSVINKKVDSQKEEVKQVDSQDIAVSHDTRGDGDDVAQAHVPIRISNNRNDSKVRELELRVELLEAELRETAAAEIALYSVIAEHGSSANKVHTPARRLSRHFIHALKNCSREKMGSAARSASSGLVLVAKACGYDVARLSFWLSNCVVLRAIVSETSKQSNGNGSNYGSKTTPRRNSASMWESLNRKKGKILSPEFDNWEDVDTFIAALKKIESWIFSRIVESIWWQAFTPHMQSANISSESLPSSNAKKCYGRITVVGNQQQATLSIDIWKKAFKEASEKLCPVRAAGHECGCLPLLAKLVMEQCISRLDVAMFNAILRESEDEIPTDPMSDPITDPKVLPIPSGKFSFGAGVQLKNAIGSWSRCLTDLFGMDMDDYPDVESGNGDNGAAELRKPFYLLNALSDLLMIPKDVLMETAIIKRILDGFVPDDFCPDPVQHSLLKALELEDHLEGNTKGIRAVPCSASPILYPYPASGTILSIIGDPRKSGSAILRKSNTSDDELDELSSPLTFISKASSNPLAKLKQIGNPNTARYKLLHEVWKLDDQ